MRNYKDFEKRYIGESDIAGLTLTGNTENGVEAHFLKFGKDDAYDAYVVEGDDVEIGAYYEKVASFKTWMRIYDDYNFINDFHSDRIDVYRAGEMGCIIHLH